VVCRQIHANDRSGDEQEADCYPKASAATLGDNALVLTGLSLFDTLRCRRELCRRGRCLVLWKIVELTHGEGDDGGTRVRLGGRKDDEVRKQE
jgi:hypothetical protein